MTLLRRLCCRALMVALPVAALMPAYAPLAAQAQFSIGYKFLDAVKKRDGGVVDEMLQSNAGTVINARDYSTGRTALHIVVDRRDASFLGYLLQKGANPNLGDKTGTTPLIAAARLGWIEGIDWLVSYKAVIDASNNSGETALIIATQAHNADLVRALMRAGANPDKQDRVAGMSALDYAKQDARGAAILAILKANSSTGASDKAKPQPELDFSGAPVK